jgi:hypothetical protein
VKWTPWSGRGQIDPDFDDTWLVSLYLYMYVHLYLIKYYILYLMEF